MVSRIGGNRRKTRMKFKKEIREKGKLSLTKYFQTFEEGDKVTLKADSAVQKGMYHPRFHGKAGVVTAQRGRCYEITVKDGNKPKSVIVHPIHLNRR